VLIDRPELHLGAGEGARFVSVLRAFAPEAQLIVATSDADVLELAGPEATITVEAQ
jgi:hypothetical protein